MKIHLSHRTWGHLLLLPLLISVRVHAEEGVAPPPPAGSTTAEAAPAAEGQLAPIPEEKLEEAKLQREAEAKAAAETKAAEAKANAPVGGAEKAIPPPPPAAAKSDSGLAEAAKDLPPPVPVVEGAPAPTIADGSRITLEGKGFTLIPPQGWQVRRDLPRTSLFLQAPRKSESEYPRNIAVVKFNGPKLINDTSAEEFANYLVKNFPSASSEISDYQIRNHQSVQMNDGREGILFYTDFKVRDIAMMQAHVLVSSQNHHYLVSYTDIADHFENPQGGSEYLSEAWGAMISIELDSPNPQPLEGVQNTAIYVAILVLLGAGIGFWRNRTAGRLYRDYGEMDPGEAAEIEPRTNALEGDGFTETNIDLLEESKPAKVFSFRTQKMVGAKSKHAESEVVSKHDDDDLPRDQWKVS